MSKFNLLISTEDFDLPNILTTPTLKRVDWDNVECLIFHSSSDSDFDIIRTLNAKAKNKIPKLIYINKELKPLYYCIFTGYGADIYAQEEFLQDADIISYIIETYKETGMTIKSPNEDLDKLAEGIAQLSESSLDNIEKMVTSPFWLNTLKLSVSNVESALERSNEINSGVVIMFEDFLDEIEKLAKEIESTSERSNTEINNLRKTLSDYEKNNNHQSSPFLYSEYPVPLNADNVVYLKSYGNCRYLISFMVAYQHYLKVNKQYQCKMLLIFPKLPINVKRYTNVATRIAQDSIEMINYKDTDLYVTFEPSKRVLDAFFKKQQSQIFIVVDAMLGDKLISGAKVKNLYGISGISDVERFSLKPERCILPILKTSGINIPHIPKYIQAGETVRRSMYLENCKESYAKMDKIIIGEGR